MTEKDSRQVKRAKERELKKNGSKATHKIYYIELERKSRNGVLHTYYKKIVDIIGLNKKTNDEPRIENIEYKGESKC